MEATQPATELVIGIENETNRYLVRIRQIDKILAGSVRTLIRLGMEKKKDSVYFPTWISERVKAKKEDHLLTQCLCCGTLQRLWRVRRRFSWLDEVSYAGLKKLQEELVSSLTPQKSPDPAGPSEYSQCVKLLHSPTFGGLNPFTASQVFWVLLNAGEDHAHGSMGFVAFFAMVWPLCRKFPDTLTIGGRIEPWEVTAYITEKCLLPGKTLQTIITKRADLLDAIGKNLVRLKGLFGKNESPRKRWLFNAEIDNLSANLRLLSVYSIVKDAFKNCAAKVEEQSNKMCSDSDNEAIYREVLVAVGEALIAVREKSKEVFNDAEKVVRAIREDILKHLDTMCNNDSSEEEKKDAYAHLTAKPLRLKFAEEYRGKRKYWKDLAKAAKKSCEYCEKALVELKVAGQICLEIEAAEHDPNKIEIEAHEKSLVKALEEIASANRKVLAVLDRPVRDATRWCRSVVDREIAHASAENVTDFDPSELVSAIAVAVRWKLMATPLQVSDAVTKALAGARGDGSWRPGKPFFSPNHAFGIWAPTSDIVWTLTSAIEQFPKVRKADDELFNYVNWLERTQITISSTPAIRADPAKPDKPFVGWASERLRDRRKIHVSITALSINALLEIRDLVEYRLWELCKKRFSVVKIDKFLKDVDPVDLGAAHPKRLHRRLTRMARDAQGQENDAEYSLVLHGPPGSSKTKVAEALSGEMWKSSSRWGPKDARLIRITPADFTRLGEDRLDSEARLIFDLISGVRAVTILFDEIDDLLRQRPTDGTPPRFMDLVVPAMLNRLADLRSACPRQEICFLLATNYVENIDSALIRKGRIDDSIPVVYPDFESRVAIISKQIGRKVKAKVSVEIQEEAIEPSLDDTIADFLDVTERREEVARRTGGWPYLAIISFCNSVTRALKEQWSPVASDNETNFEDLLDKRIRDHQSSLSKPEYDKRLRHTTELRNEYWHHIISCCQNLPGCKDLFYKQTTTDKIKEFLPEIDERNTSKRAPSASGDQRPFETELDEVLESIFRKEKRQV